jgi:hypothetical protein
LFTYPKFRSPPSVVRPVEAEFQVEVEQNQEAGDKEAELDVEPDDSDLVPNGPLPEEHETDISDEEQIQVMEGEAAVKCGELITGRGEADKVSLEPRVAEESHIEDRIASDIRIDVDGRGASMKNGLPSNSQHVTIQRHKKIVNRSETTE